MALTDCSYLIESVECINLLTILLWITSTTKRDSSFIYITQCWYLAMQMMLTPPNICVQGEPFNDSEVKISAVDTFVFHVTDSNSFDFLERSTYTLEANIGDHGNSSNSESLLLILFLLFISSSKPSCQSPCSLQPKNKRHILSQG